MLREEIYRLSLISYGRKMTQNEVCYKTTGVLVIWRSQIAARVGHQSPSGLSANATEPSQLGSVWDGLGGGLHLAGRPFFGKCYPGGRKLAVSFSMTPPPPLGAFQVWPMTQTQTVRRPAIWPLSADFRTRVSEHAGQPQTQQTQGGGGKPKILSLQRDALQTTGDKHDSLFKPIKTQQKLFPPLCLSHCHGYLC